MPLHFSLMEDIMGNEYVLYSLKYQGWMRRDGQYISDWKEGERFTSKEAFTRIKIHMGSGKSLVLIPVNVIILESITA